MLDDATKKKVLHRLKRIEGQVAGLSRMIEDDAYCVDVLIQMSAVQGALAKAGQVILNKHVETCVKNALASGDVRERTAKVDELMDVFGRYGRFSSR